MTISHKLILVDKNCGSDLSYWHETGDRKWVWALTVPLKLVLVKTRCGHINGFFYGKFLIKSRKSFNGSPYFLFGEILDSRRNSWRYCLRKWKVNIQRFTQ